MTTSPEDITHLRRDKYNDDANADMSADIARLESGEPLAYVIGWIPFLGLRIYLDSHPLIPRPETEYWVEKLIAHLKSQYGDTPFTFLDLCAGSGAIGLSVLATFTNAQVAFGELEEEHAVTIMKNIRGNHLDASRTSIHIGDTFEPFTAMQFDCIAANPPYIPSGRTLDESVTNFEPPTALFSGTDGMDVIKKIIERTPSHINPGGTLWTECDIENIESTAMLLMTCRHAIHTDQYGRPRYVVAFY